MLFIHKSWRKESYLFFFNEKPEIGSERLDFIRTALLKKSSSANSSILSWFLINLNYSSVFSKDMSIDKAKLTYRLSKMYIKQ